MLRLPPHDPELTQALNARSQTLWVRQLIESQLPDGSWGRFHTQDTKLKTVFRTTEEAINRAYALGLTSVDAPLPAVISYMEKVLRHEATLSDRVERHEAFPVLIRYIVAGRLAQLDPANQLLQPFWEKQVLIAGQAFTSGSYHLEDEAFAYPQLFGVHAPEGFLESQHALWLLSSRPLPPLLDFQIVDWVYRKPDGIRYLRAPLIELHPWQIGYWLRSMFLLSRFASWREIAAATLNRLWEQRGVDGLWDFGNRISACVDFPLSSSWRMKNARQQDYSTLVLVLLRRCFD